ncbi:hypothetical protein GIB67_022479 [Kingdonia uniflora]|uniref:Uncharacterized protein n=1 Tax=Kingdonia uniflora TaxID=39325 RepID=A0A7J7KZT6_9MAGN|nr:hypothetical protein GIB67_022479 [Kingdonia uniflora]
MVDDVVKVNLEAISSEYGGGLLKWKKGDEKDNDDKKDVEEIVKSEEEQSQASADQTTAVSTEEQTLEVEKIDDEASQASTDQITIVSVEEQTIKFQLVLIKSEVDVTLKKRHALTEEEINERAFKMDEKNQVDQVWSLRKDELSIEAKKDNKSTYMSVGEETVCLNALYTLYLKKWLDNEVIDVYIKALIQYFDTQYRDRPDKEKIVLADVFACQYIGRAFNVWTTNMSSPEGVELKKKLICDQITSMQWDRTVSNCIHRGDLKARKICIYDSMVDTKITNARKKKKLSPKHQLIEDQISTILPKILIWRDFADRSSPPTGSEGKSEEKIPISSWKKVERKYEKGGKCIMVVKWEENLEKSDWTQNLKLRVNYANVENGKMGLKNNGMTSPTPSSSLMDSRKYVKHLRSASFREEGRNYVIIKQEMGSNVRTPRTPGNSTTSMLDDEKVNVSHIGDPAIGDPKSRNVFSFENVYRGHKKLVVNTDPPNKFVSNIVY